ncbi:hypothetical protein GCT13_37170 [Paraburkholderia sp. CNPSo 3157]|uniref:Uncharacterized protein n=1 Tax=Paraburkholderia franconis TaxID=2654983 RepID=A0A7X1NI85_9BURK|nr:hypothetical protein [Paraburkholderia franconis]
MLLRSKADRPLGRSAIFWVRPAWAHSCGCKSCHELVTANEVIFSDGMEPDYLRFTAGMEATVTLAGDEGCLVV